MHTHPPPEKNKQTKHMRCQFFKLLVCALRVLRERTPNFSHVVVDGLSEFPFFMTAELGHDLWRLLARSLETQML